jgi:serine/threonine-protein kinase HipA
MMVSERLSVYLHNSVAGQLWLDDTGRIAFQYDPGYIEDPDAIPLSLSLPLRAEPFLDDTARPFFSNY